MKAFTLSALSTLFAGLSLAHPIELKARQGGFSDVDIAILQFALTLEHLENAFYSSAFSAFTLQNFLDSGFDEDFFLNLQFIAADEAAHVDFLSRAIQSAGVFPVQPCKYNFPVTDIASFVTLSAILESIGTSAYLGAAPFVDSKDILSVAASIMAVEGFHTSLQRTSLGAIGAPDPFATPLGANAVFTLAAQFIVSCPSTNPPLPFTAFPGLSISGAQTCLRENSFIGQNAQFGQGASFTSGANFASITTVAGAAVTDINVTSVTDSSVTIAETTSATESTSATATATETSSETATAASTTMTSGATATGAAERRDLDTRQNSFGCTAPFAGSTMNLIPDFRGSKFNFNQVVTVFVTFVAGFNVISVPVVISSSGINVVIPTGIAGQVFIFITIIDISGGFLSDSDILFGPAIFEVAPQFPGIGF